MHKKLSQTETVMLQMLDVTHEYMVRERMHTHDCIHESCAHARTYASLNHACVLCCCANAYKGKTAVIGNLHIWFLYRALHVGTWGTC